jgi:hypothetical protein
MKYDFFIGLAMSELNEKEYEELSIKMKQLNENLKSKKINIFCELLTITKNNYQTPIESLNKDLTAIDESKNFIFYYPKKQNTSLFIEIGYAIAKEIPITIFTKNKKDLPYLLQELNLKKDNKIYLNTNFDFLEKKLKEIINKT